MRSFFQDERGSAASEYVFLLAVIGTGVLAGMSYLGGAVAGGLENAATVIGSMVFQ